MAWSSTDLKWWKPSSVAAVDRNQWAQLWTWQRGFNVQWHFKPLAPVHCLVTQIVHVAQLYVFLLSVWWIPWLAKAGFSVGKSTLAAPRTVTSLSRHGVWSSPLKASHKRNFHYNVWTLVDWLGTGGDVIVTFTLHVYMWVSPSEGSFVVGSTEGLLSR